MRNSLQLATDAELIEELFQRFDHIVVSGSRRHEHGDNAHREIWQWKGLHRYCQGLCASLLAKIEEDSRKREVAG